MSPDFLSLHNQHLCFMFAWPLFFFFFSDHITLIFLWQCNLKGWDHSLIPEIAWLRYEIWHIRAFHPLDHRDGHLTLDRLRRFLKWHHEAPDNKDSMSKATCEKPKESWPWHNRWNGGPTLKAYPMFTLRFFTKAEFVQRAILVSSSCCNYYKCSNLKQHKFTFLQSCR